MRSLGIIILLSAAGCTATTDLGTGAKLSVDYFGGTDAVGFHFTVDRVACYEGESFERSKTEFNVNLLDSIVPAMVTVVEETFDADSRHLAADLFTSLPAGCYDVEAAPASYMDVDVASDWKPSADCSVASLAGVEVEESVTTDVVLFSQCVGDEAGALDTTVVINNPPYLTVEIDEKFNYECETVEVCVTGFDANDDPIAFAWDFTGAYAKSISDKKIVGFEAGHRVWQQCADVTTRFTKTYDFSVSIYDLDATGARFEDRDDVTDSSATMQFPVHTNWIEEPMCMNAEGDAVAAAGSSVERYAGCAYTTAEAYYCNAANTYEVDADVRSFLCKETVLVESALYPTCPSS